MNELVLFDSATGEVQTFSAQVTNTALALPDNLGFDKWVEFGHGLDRMSRAVMWWLGDWWAYGGQQYGERIKAVEGLGWEFQTCADAGWVARSIETSRRREVLPWQHHKEVAALDTAVQAWHPQGFGTPDRLRALCAARWRPQDVHALSSATRKVSPARPSVVVTPQGGLVAMSRIVEQWVVQAGVLLRPQRVLQVSAPCPACGAQTVYRRDGLGEHVKQPALQITETGCTCQACKAVWLPQHFPLLIRVLGLEPPAGVG